MNGRILTLGAALLLATACGTSNAATVSATATTHAAAAAAATMTPAEMAAMTHATAAATPAATAGTVATIAVPAAPAVNTAATAAPAAIGTAAPGPTSAPVPASAATPVPTVAPTAAPPAPAASATVKVTLVDMAIRLSVASVSAGTVTFAVTNAGTTIHELDVLQTSIAQNALPADPSNSSTVQEPGFIGRVATLAPGASGSLTLTLAAGSYVLICNEPAHYSALGMHIAFSVK